MAADLCASEKAQVPNPRMDRSSKDAFRWPTPATQLEFEEVQIEI